MQAGQGRAGPPAAAASAEALRAAERRFRTLVEQSPVSTQVFAPDGTTLLVNRAWEALWGATLGQLADYNILRDPQLAAQGVLPVIERAFAGEAQAIPAIQYEPDRTIAGLGAVPYRRVRAVIYPGKDDAGRVQEVILQHEDVTERAEAEAALRRSEARFRALVQHSSELVYVRDLDGAIRYISPAVERLLGYRQEELLGRDRTALVHPGDLAAIAGQIARLEREGAPPGPLEYRLRHRDGSWRRMAGTAANLLDEPSVRGIVVNCRDITERKRAEEEQARLYAAARRARAAAAGAAARTARLQAVRAPRRGAHPRRRRRGGRRAGAGRGAGRRLARLRRGEPGAGRRPGRRRAPGGGAPRRQLRHPPALRGRAVARAGGDAPPGCRGGGLRAPHAGRRPGAGRRGARRPGAAERPAAAAPGRRSGRAAAAGRARVGAGRGPLRGPQHPHRPPARPGARQWARPAPDQGRVARHLALLRDQVGRLGLLVGDLLDASRIQQGRLALRPEPCDLAALARAAAEQLRQAPEHTPRHRLLVEAPAPVEGTWDRDRLAQVLTNLIANALKYSPAGGAGRVRVAQAPDGGAEIVVSDEGLGIPREEQAGLFQPFVRASTVNERIGGTGLGLYIVRHIVEAHGGAVALASEPDRGTTVTVRLPRGGDGRRAAGGAPPGGTGA